MSVEFTTGAFDDGTGPMWAILSSDEYGLVLGEWDEVLNAYQAIKRLIETHQADEEIADHDERLGVPWLSVSDAARQFNVPADTVRYAARNGHIRNAVKQGNLWRFPQRTFLYWLTHAHNPRS